MPNWKTQYENNGRRKAPPGTKEKIEYIGKYDQKGHLELVENGKVNTYEQIQADAKSVDIHSIMRRYNAGEVDVLNRVQGFYADVSNLPTNYIDVLNAVHRGQALFESIPKELRAKFDHNFDKFMTALCDGSIANMLGKSPTPVLTPAIPNPSPAEKGDE